MARLETLSQSDSLAVTSAASWTLGLMYYHHGLKLQPCRSTSLDHMLDVWLESTHAPTVERLTLSLFPCIPFSLGFWKPKLNLSQKKEITERIKSEATRINGFYPCVALLVAMAAGGIKTDEQIAIAFLSIGKQNSEFLNTTAIADVIFKKLGKAGKAIFVEFKRIRNENKERRRRATTPQQGRETSSKRKRKQA